MKAELKRPETIFERDKMSLAAAEVVPTMPLRPFGSACNISTLPPSVSMVGLGCSSFSNFFSTQGDSTECWSVDRLDKAHPNVVAWIRVIDYAVNIAGITLLDTAPWYGHGTSEAVIGWALDELSNRSLFARERLIINTKVGRYEADPAKQFDFSAVATKQSVKRSLERMRCGNYIDVLQLHDPEFAPSLEILMHETIPAMLECRKKGWCRALGMTGK